MKRAKNTRHVPYFVFTPATIQTAQEALSCFKHMLQRVAYSDTKTVFAEATMNHVKSKLDAMYIAGNAPHLTIFDYNEKIVLAAAIQLYTFDLLATPAHAQRDLKLKHCRQISRFALGHVK